MRKRGRPPLYPDVTPARVHVTISPSSYDRAEALARARGTSVPSVIRRALDSALAEQNKQPKKYDI